jgi:hypothetical protein
MEEHAIVDAANLPTHHPMRQAKRKGHQLEKFDTVVEQLRSGDREIKNKAFDGALFVFQHDEWYATEAYTFLAALIASYPHFSSKQRAILACPPALRSGWSDDDY